MQNSTFKVVNLLLLSLVTATLFNCSQKKEEVKIRDSSLTFSYSIDSISIDTDSRALHSYPQFHIFSSSNQDILAGYNYYIHTIDFFNISSKKQLNRLDLSKGETSNLDKVLDLYVHNSDSIFLYTRENISIIDSAGHLKHQIDLAELANSFDFIDNEFSLNPFFKLEYLKGRKTILLFNAVLEKTERLTSPIIFELDLVKNTVTPLPIKYSPYFRENNGDFGHLAYVNKGITSSDVIVYNFLYESDIYTYNLKTSQIESYSTQSKNSQRHAHPLLNDNGDNRLWSVHALQNAHYFPVLYDSHNDIYYRFHWKELGDSLIDVQNPNALSKELSLMIFDHEFKKIDELDLPSNTYSPHTWILTESGLYISPGHPNNRKISPNLLTLHLIKFKPT